MVSRFFFSLGQEVRGMHQAAYLLALFALLSQLLALVRDRLLAAHFGVSHTLDLYYAAFRIPDFLFATVASLLSLYALLPVLSRLERENPGLVVSFMRQILLLFFAGMAVISGVVFVFAPVLVPLAVPGIPDHASLILLVRILLLQPIFLGASNIVASLTQLRSRFLLYAVSPLLYNIGIIIGIVGFYPRFGLAGLAWGVVLGAVMHFCVQLPFFAAERGVPLPLVRTLRSLRETIWLSVPRTLSLSAGQLSLLALVALASLLSAGSISVFMFAFNLQAVPLAVIGVSYSVAAFPTLARLYASGEGEEFLRHIETALRHMLLWAIPATIGVIVLRAQIVRVILGSGAFDWSATRLVAAALALFIISLAAQGITLLIARAYYAAGRTKPPLVFGILSVVISIASALLLVALFHESSFARHFLEALLRVGGISGTTVLLLALGYALGALAAAAAGLVRLSRDFGLNLAGVRRLSFQSFCAAVIAGFAAYATLAFLGTFLDLNTVAGIMLQGACGGLAYIAVTIVMLMLLKNPELAEALSVLSRRFRGTPPALEPTDVSS